MAAVGGVCAPPFFTLQELLFSVFHKIGLLSHILFFLFPVFYPLPRRSCFLLLSPHTILIDFIKRISIYNNLMHTLTCYFSSILTIFHLGGTGAADRMSIRADETLKKCDTIIGYTVYVNLLKEDYPGKEYLTTPMTQEARRCEMAFEEAQKGKTVAMVCSGDAGVYGMSGLMLEIGAGYPDIEVEVIPGVTAALSGGAVLGAPLTHDFAVVSLSDRLTPWEKIEKRLRLAAEADFSLAIYNPASKGRPDYLQKACDILLSVLPADRICGTVENIGREGECAKIYTLGELRNAEVNMFTTVFIGNSMTKEIGGRMVTPRGYRI